MFLSKESDKNDLCMKPVISFAVSSNFVQVLGGYFRSISKMEFFPD